ncbi:MAG: carbohydrate ABC transporter permease [Clostridia bacterium]|nr:carbohydrate ABC transporter permease [Clostridia bacterium]
MFQVDVDYLKRAKKRRDYAPWVITFFLTFAGIISALPIVYLIVTAFKPAEELFLYPPRFYVSNPTTKNFADLFAISSDSLVPFTRYLFNTVLVTVCYIFLLIIVSSLACYPLSKHKFPGHKGMFSLITTALMFVSGAAAVPSYLIVTGLQLDNTYLVYIIPLLANPTCLFLMKQFMDQVPDSIFEAGRIDGASEWQLYTKIAVPLLKNACATCIILTFGSVWGDAATATTYIYDEQLRNLAFYMNTLQGGLARTGANSAAGLLMTIPSILVFVLSQSKVMDTMAHSGIK